MSNHIINYGASYARNEVPVSKLKRLVVVSAALNNGASHGRPELVVTLEATAALHRGRRDTRVIDGEEVAETLARHGATTAAEMVGQAWKEKPARPCLGRIKPAQRTMKDERRGA